MQQFKHQILAGDILDPMGTHHEFASGGHGRKLDFDLIETDSDLYKEWVGINVHTIKQKYDPLPSAVLGVANGTNRLAIDAAHQLGIPGLSTKKASSRQVELTESSHRLLVERNLEFLLVLEDVGTSGGTACSAALSALECGVNKVEVLVSWQRTDELTALVNANVSYDAIIKEVLPTYLKDECIKNGFCSIGWDLITHP